MKQRRNREKATELITVLDDIVPAKYPYRSFSAPSSDADSTLKKRSRNKTLEDVIDAVRAEIAKADDSGRAANAGQNASQVRMRDVLCSSVDVLGIVILYDDGEVHSSSEAGCRVLGLLVGHRVFVSSGGWFAGVQGVMTCEASAKDVVVVDLPPGAQHRRPTRDDKLRTL
eukprot:CAMPEP_0172174462 /NCGR_PEP_ID=MMETSP1050-20130122/13678_1 /TAXON_ID=233186 /ORGANISM="Cryptomonas curvata, Strain CCAP979/52" /LENGTH=170 /DNA_ID=CAMNT_0012846441 /DNA_START=270 /DNA_END=778 /DNA_ORIENTATION=+